MKGISPKQRVYLLLVLTYMSVFVGSFGSDPSLREGKNVIMFLLFYVIGDSLKYYKRSLGRIKTKRLLVGWVLFNTLVVTAFSLIGFGGIADVIFRMFFFGYCSPMLIVNAIIFFVIISRIKIQSHFINEVSKSSLTIYMIHSTLILLGLFSPMVLLVYGINSKPIAVLGEMLILTCVIVAGCMVVYWLLTPVWKIVNFIASSAQKKYELSQ